MVNVLLIQQLVDEMEKNILLLEDAIKRGDKKRALELKGVVLEIQSKIDSLTKNVR